MIHSPILHRWRGLLLGPQGGALLGALATLVVLMALWWRAGQWYKAQLQTEQRAEAAVEVSTRSNALSSAVNRRLERLQGLEAWVQAEATSPQFEANFELYAAGLYNGSFGVRNVAIAPESVVRYVYPLVGNESLLGYEPLKDPRSEIRTDAQRAIRSHAVVLTGPTELVQGGLGLIARKAIYRESGYWGLVNIVLDVPPLLAEAGMDEPHSNLRFALRDDRGRVFFGSGQLFDQAPVMARVNLITDSYWELAGAPSVGWTAAVQEPLLLFQRSGLVIVLLVTCLTYLTVNRQARLSLAVQRRTQELSLTNAALKRDIAERRQTEAALREREEQYRSVFESTTDALLILDLADGRLVDFNPAACRLHGYTEEEFRQLQPAQLIHPDTYHRFEAYIEGMRAGREFRSPGLNMRKDGTPFHVDILGAAFTYRGRPHTLAVLRDITEQVEAYQLLEQRVEERTRELSTLLEVSRNVTAILELDPLLGLILDQLKGVLDYGGASIMTLADQVFRVRAYRGPVPQGTALRLQLPVTDAFAQQIIGDRQPVLVADVQEDIFQTRLIGQPAQEGFNSRRYVRALMGVPLMAREKVIGLLTLHHSEPHYFSTKHAELAMAFANQAAVAIENAQLYEQAHTLAALQERQKLARELHDSVSQALYGIALGTRTARTLLEREGLDEQQANVLAKPLDYVMSLAEAGLTEMRALIFELRPESLETEGLVAALRRQADALRARHGLEVDALLANEPDVPLAIKEALWRVSQEALHNIVKHAAANRATLRLGHDDGAIWLEISDDGRGFDAQGSFPGHLGLKSMRERIEGVRGSFQIESAPDRGARLRARVPLEGKEP